ncbi:penicillin-binding protein 2 [Candidatus Peregrinibacteria bacterium]|nr:penicillin-binding protein 2 [Candidatus Peregrinibacteria bacterium]
MFRRLKINRIYVLLFLSFLAFATIVWQMFSLQIINKDYYASKAEQSHLGYSEVEPKRGEILIQDYQSKETFRLATNTSFPLLFADPTLIKDPAYVADKLAPIIFDSAAEKEKDKERIRKLKQLLPDNPSKEELAAVALLPEEEMRKNFRSELFEKLGQKTRQSIILYKDPPEDITLELQKHSLSGIEVTKDAITAYPSQISDRDYAAKILAPFVDIPFERLSELLIGRNRYVVLRQRLPTDVEQKTRKLFEEAKLTKNDNFAGINLQEKTYRYYPEGSLAAQIIGFTSDRGGVYGIEQSFDSALRGKKGISKTKLDATGQPVIVGDVLIQAAREGDDITLTIDRSIQMAVEKLLAKAVQDSRADSGLVIIIEPKTGRIIALAHYPSFNPNEFSKALETEDIRLTDEEIKNIVTVGEPGNEINYLYLDPDSHYRIQVFKNILENGKTIVSKFKNILGTGVYRNRAVADLYEPGSVFKAIIMSVAIDDGDVTPQTTFNDVGPIKVDEFEIHNALNTYYGVTTMREVLEKSLNTGMAFVARKVGRELMYRYIKKFGFNEKTYIEFENEQSAQVEDPSQWAESELVTRAFGQGISVTPIQLAIAISTLANKGILMKPHIVLRTENADGKIAEYEPEEVRRVISEKAAATIGAMMVSAVENGVARHAAVAGYRIAGKTGTAQTYKNGKPLTGPGTTIVSFVGFAPLKEPRFAALIKIDRPRSSIWADVLVAPLFADIAKFLFKYYNIPPDA